MSRAYVSRAQTVAASDATAFAATATTPLLQRACDCETDTAEQEECPTCAGRDDFGVQKKTRLGAPGDAFEQEADRIADQVMSSRPAPLPLVGSVSTVQRSTQDRSERSQRNAAPTATATSRTLVADNAPAEAAAAAVSSGGTTLTQADRQFFEPRFGRDLSHIRLHTDSTAASAASGVGALAFTLREHIAFAPGQYAPGSGHGRRLLAHELVHTLQQGAGDTLRRTCPSDPAQIPAGGSDEFEQAVDDIRALQAYIDLAPEVRDVANHIIDGARGSACPMYYIEQLNVLFTTPVASRGDTSAEMRRRAAEGEAAEQVRLSDPGWAAMTGVEEAASAAPERRWRLVPRFVGTTHEFRYRIDDRDPTQIYVQLRVLLRPHGTGTPADVDRTKAQEDGIETSAMQHGYVLDVVFVDRGGPDVFEANVDPSQWTNAGNWNGDADSMAHEAHHLLGLEDRYDYLQHAHNEHMPVATRLHWFREQMVRAADPLSVYSRMRDDRNGETFNEQDVCALLRQERYRDCLVSRFALRPAREIEGIATGLSHPYEPQNAAMLEVLSDAWDRRPFEEVTADCAEGDPLCGLPPIGAFGDSNIVAMDAYRFPLTNPHEQPSGETLERTPRTRP